MNVRPRHTRTKHCGIERGEVDASGDYRSMIDGFVSSLEYRARFGP